VDVVEEVIPRTELLVVTGSGETADVWPGGLVETHRGVIDVEEWPIMESPWWTAMEPLTCAQVMILSDPTGTAARFAAVAAEIAEDNARGKLPGTWVPPGLLVSLEEYRAGLLPVSQRTQQSKECEALTADVLARVVDHLEFGVGLLLSPDPKKKARGLSYARDLLDSWPAWRLRVEPEAYALDEVLGFADWARSPHRDRAWLAQARDNLAAFVVA
jgi:hypothetical protein